MDPNTLLRRLDEIGFSLEKNGHALALIGVGSVGQERGRLDEFSDLDFFAVVEDGWKQAYLDDLGWLSSLCPLAYCFANTPYGFKLLFADGIFCEFAVFEMRQLQEAQFAPGRVIWKRPELPETIGQPAHLPAQPAPRSVEWLVGEALTNLYVGLGRDRRGEKLSALRFIQGYAVDRLLELADRIETPLPADRIRLPASGALSSGTHMALVTPGWAQAICATVVGAGHFGLSWNSTLKSIQLWPRPSVLWQPEFFTSFSGSCTL